MADTALAALTASGALTGTELFYSDNGATDVKVTATQLQTFCRSVGGASQAFDSNAGSETPTFQVLGTTGAAVGVARFNAASSAGRIYIGKSRGATVGSFTIIQDNDTLGELVWNGSDGAQFQAGARIHAQVDGTPGAGDMPTELIFGTTQDGQGSPTDAWSIHADGNLVSTGPTGADTGIIAGARGLVTKHTFDTTSGAVTPVSIFNSQSNHPAAFYRWTASSNRGAAVYFGKSNSNTVGTHALVDSGEDFAEIGAGGSDGVEFLQSCYIRFVNDDLASPGGSTEADTAPVLASIPGSIWFATTGTGAGGPSRRWAINGAGSLFPYTDDIYNFGKPECRPELSYFHKLSISDGTPTVATSFINYDFLAGTAPVAQIQSANALGCAMALGRWSNSTGGSSLLLSKSRSGTIGTMTVLASNDIIGTLAFEGTDGAQLQTAATIHVAADNTPGAGDMPGRIVFSTTADGAHAVTERMRINRTGLVSIVGSVLMANATAVPAGGTASLGYKFSSATDFGIFFGSGAPTLAAAQGSLYMRSDGAGTATRLYVNTNGTTGWTNFTSAT